jgi:hypothetical protein
MKFASDRPFADPDKATRRLMEPRAFEPAQDGRILHREDQRPVLVRREGHSSKVSGSLFPALLSSQKLQVIERSCVNGFD